MLHDFLGVVWFFGSKKFRRQWLEAQCEAEFKSMVATTAEVPRLRGLFGELGVKLTKSVKMFFDSKVVIQIAANPIFHKRQNILTLIVIF